MNILKNIPYIFIIFFVVISHVHCAADGRECTKLKGSCMNPNSCIGTIKSGLCPGGDDNKCCIPPKPSPPSPSSPPSPPSPPEPSIGDDSKCTSQGGTCKNPNSCKDGQVKSGLCPGGDDNKCCIPNPPKSQTAWTPWTPSTPNGDDSKCTNQGGKCMNPSSCKDGQVISGLCPGGNDNKCCIPTTPNDDSKCTNQGGKCMNPSNCKDGQVLSGLCPGGNDNKCCISNSPKPSITWTPLKPSTSSTPNDDDSKCTNQGGRCMNPSSCKDGQVIFGLCPGGNNNKCCIPTTPNDDSKCTNKGGKCMNPSNCKDGQVLSGLCPGGNDNKCCISNQSPDSDSDDSKCTNKGGRCMNPSSCKDGKVKSGLCPGGNNNKCCIPNTSTTDNKPNTSVEGVGSKCSYKNVSGKCIDINNTKCGTTLVTHKCKGPSNVLCCLSKKVKSPSSSTPSTSSTPSVEGVGSKCSYQNASGKCIDVNNTKCGTSLVNNRCKGPSNVKCCLNRIPSTGTGSNGTSTVSHSNSVPTTSVPSGESGDIINNLRNNLNYDSHKNAAMLTAATDLLSNGFDPKFVAGVLGNILAEGTPGKFESSNYSSNPSDEPAYLVYMDENFDYRNTYSGRSIIDIGIDSAVDIANKARDTGYEGKFGLGMIQWTGERTNNLLDVYQSKSTSNYPSLDECASIEASFMVSELQSSSYSYIYDTWQSDPTPYNAGSLICINYEVPSDRYNKAVTRGNNAETIYGLMF